MPDTFENAQILRISLKGAQDTQAFGRTLAAILRVGDVVALSGDLGVGKSTLARAVIQKLTNQDEVPSPTFTLVQTYGCPNGDQVWHFDCYRLSQAEEAYELGIEEAFDDAICLIEWPEKLEGLLPSQCLWLVLEEAGNGRQLDIFGTPNWAQRLKALDLEIKTR